MFPLLDLDKVLAVHTAALEYTVRVQIAASKKAEGETTNLVARSAISCLMHDIACLHQAIVPLCGTGWACATPVLLRTMLEGGMSLAVIINSDRPDVGGFKYLYQKIPDEMIDPARKAAIEKERGANIDKHLPQMAPEDQEAAKAFLTTPPAGPYWYSGMFRGPAAVIRKYLNPEMLNLYSLLSIAAHAGFVGLRQFRDEPDKLDINPRTDPGAQGFSMISSSRVLVEATHLREGFEGFRDGGYEKVLKMIVECAR